MNSLEEIMVALGRSDRVLICGHVMPDGDCLGSMLALGLTLEEMGKKVTMAGPDPVPQSYDFLPGLDRVQIGGPPEGAFDTFVVVDCSVPERLGAGSQDLLAKDMVIINMDHHAGSLSFGSYRYIDQHAAAVGEIIFDLFSLMQVTMTPEVALCLYTAIVTDTGSFQYDNTTPGTHRRIARLLELGAPAAQINVKLYEEKPEAALHLLGAALDTLTLSPCGKVCWMTVTRDVLRNAGAADEHTDGLVNYTRSIKGVQVGLFFREIAEGRCKISFRSKDAVDVNRLAAQFGGGGHARAAGCVLQGSIEDIQTKIVKAAILAAGGAHP